MGLLNMLELRNTLRDLGLYPNSSMSIAQAREAEATEITMAYDDDLSVVYDSELNQLVVYAVSDVYSGDIEYYSDEELAELRARIDDIDSALAPFNRELEYISEY